MIPPLYGWQRLWIVLSCLYLFVVAGYVAVTLPQPEGILYSYELLKKLSNESRDSLVPIDKNGWMSVGDTGTEVEMPNGIRLPFKKGVSDNQMSVTAKEYWAVVTATATERRWLLIGYAVLWWVAPCAVLYLFGWALGWVYRGFRIQKGNGAR